MSFPFANHPADSTAREEDQVIELTLSLPVWQASQLEQVAWEHDLTVGQLLRQLASAVIAENLTMARPSAETPPWVECSATTKNKLRRAR
jgi:hypothetical protein